MRLWYLSHRRPAKSQARQRRSCASALSRQSLRCSHTWSMEVDQGSDQKIRHLAPLNGNTVSWQAKLTSRSAKCTGICSPIIENCPPTPPPPSHHPSWIIESTEGREWMLNLFHYQSPRNLCGVWDSNSQPLDLLSDELPTALNGQVYKVL